MDLCFKCVQSMEEEETTITVVIDGCAISDTVFDITTESHGEYSIPLDGLPFASFLAAEEHLSSSVPLDAIIHLKGQVVSRLELV